jgi:hypothetical protein
VVHHICLHCALWSAAILHQYEVTPGNDSSLHSSVRAESRENGYLLTWKEIWKQ